MEVRNGSEPPKGSLKTPPYTLHLAPWAWRPLRPPRKAREVGSASIPRMKCTYSNYKVSQPLSHSLGPNTPRRPHPWLTVHRAALP
eukprot:scaffold3238_cov60-Phaeocystis_antarctica.AAC.10